MPGWLLNFARTGAQALWGYLVAHVTVLAVVPQDTAVNWLVTTLFIGGAAAGLHWLETRKGDAFWPRAARRVASILMVGLTGAQPVYVEPGQNLRVIGADGLARPPR